MFKWVMANQYRTCPESDYEDLLQLVLIRVTKDMKYFRPNRGMSAVSFLRCLIQQEIHKQKRRIEKKAQHLTYDNTITITETIEPRFNPDYQGAIEHVQAFVSGSSLPSTQQTIIRHVLSMLYQPDKWINSSKDAKVQYIHRKCHAPKERILHVMRLLAASGSLGR